MSDNNGLTIPINVIKVIIDDGNRRVLLKMSNDERHDALSLDFESAWRMANLILVGIMEARGTPQPPAGEETE